MAEQKPNTVFHFPKKNHANSKTEARPGARVSETKPTVPTIKPSQARSAAPKPVRSANVVDTSKTQK